MKKGNRNWIIEQKFYIIQEADQPGVTEVLRSISFPFPSIDGSNFTRKAGYLEV